MLLCKPWLQRNVGSSRRWSLVTHGLGAGERVKTKRKWVGCISLPTNPKQLRGSSSERPPSLSLDLSTR